MITIKKTEEIAILREGGKRHMEILRQVAAAVTPGATAASLNALAEKLIKENDKEYRETNIRRSKLFAALAKGLNKSFLKKGGH